MEGTVGIYRAPEIQALPGKESVDSEWGVAGVVAAILGIAVSIVLAVCGFCGTLGSVSACYNTMTTWLQGAWC